MKKKFIIIGAFLILCLSTLFYQQIISGTPILVENKLFSKQSGDFILHMAVHQVEEGVEVRHSIQYIGEDPVEIKHQSPLVSVSLSNQKHTFTGSMVTKKLKSGNVYYPQDSKLIQNLVAEENGVLYINARFYADEKQLTIEHEEELKFN